MSTDPLLDSDDEMYADENTRLDYSTHASSRLASLPISPSG